MTVSISKFAKHDAEVSAMDDRHLVDLQITDPVSPKKILDLSIFPMDIKRIIVDYLILQPIPCIKALFGKCTKGTSCEQHHPSFTEPFLELAGEPSRLLTTDLGPILSNDIYHSVCTNNTFIFDLRGSRGSHGSDISDVDYRQLHSQVRRFYEADRVEFYMRDPRVTVLLDFIDQPASRVQHSFWPMERYKYVDAHRHKIRHLIFNLRYTNREVSSLRRDWDHPLKVDWMTLPHLETLVLDLRAYSNPFLRTGSLDRQPVEQKLREGAKRMGCLSLRSLTLVGLCSSNKRFGNEEHENMIKTLFKDAMHKDGEIVLIDWEQFPTY